MSIKKELTSGILITFISKYSNVLIQLIMGIILARLLSPSEFGVVAIITIFTNFFYLLTSAGINTAVIQTKDLDDESNSIIFNYTIIIGLILGLGFYYSSFLIAKFYENLVYIDFGKILIISIFFYSISCVPLAIIAKRRDFKKIAFIEISSNLISGIIGVILAYAGFSVYALIAKITIKAIVQFLMSFYYSKINIIPKINFEPLQKIYVYAGYDFAFKFLNYFTRNSDNLLIGKFLGPVSLGYYDKSYRFMLYPIQMLTHVITPVLHPILSDYQNDKRIIYTTYSKVVGILAIMGVPISIILFFSSNEVIIVLFGNQWVKSVPVFQILSLSIWIQMILSSSGSIFRSSGRTDLLFYSGVLSSITTVSGILIGVLFFKNLEALAVILVMAFTINFLQAYWIMYHYIFEKRMLELFQILLKPLIVGTVMIFSFLVFNINIEIMLMSLLYKFMLGGIAFIVTAVGIKEPITLRVFKEIKSLIINKIKKTKKHNGGK
ncbi:MAG: lipopolysaccharide biosynthesis protein [Vallitaleaceae bacterium]|nr:lipopolysaccharide biosynthesis protein [Vallitaleaceae bacterium]